MTTAFKALSHRHRYVQAALDKILYYFAAYALPILIALLSVTAAFAWKSHYPAAGNATALAFRVIADAGAELTPQQALARLDGKAETAMFDTKLAETPFWFAFDLKRTPGAPAVAIELPSRHAQKTACWDADNLQELGRADRNQVQGALAGAKAGFALGLDASLQSSRVLCQASFVGPARLTVAQWPAAQLNANMLAFHRHSGLLEGGMIVLALFMLVTALLNRDGTYLLFSAWLLVNLRVGALSAGWDFQWLGQTIPPEWMQQSRLLTITVYFIATVSLFKALFRDDLPRVGYAWLMQGMQWICVLLLPLALIMPYAKFLPVFWISTLVGVPLLVFLLIRILLIARSPVAIWYSASIAITLGASLYEVLAAAFGWKGMLGTVNSVTAALSSSLLASLALAAQMRSEHQERLEAQAELRHNYEAMPIGLFTLDLQGRFLNANPALLAMLGYDVMAPQYNQWGQYFDHGAWSQLLDQVHVGHGAELEIRSRAQGTDGEQKRYLVKAALSRGKIEGWLQDVTEKSKADENLRFMALNDPLTRVYNRRGIEQMYESATTQLADGKPLALAYLDLDRFKLINDLYGHTTGDQVLRQVCERISGMLTGTQLIGRVGGDEFVIVMPNTTMQPAAWTCRGIIGAVSTEPYRIGDKAFQVGVSIGLIDISAGTQIKDALANADRACREAKGGHNEGLVVYEKNAKAFHDREAELKLVERLSGNSLLEGLFLEMQPIMSLKTPHESLNFEVLLRMRNADGSIIPAGRIIGAAENSGRTGVVDRWVMSTTLDWIDRHYDRLSRTRFVCMNLSGASLNDERFVQDAYAMLADNPRAAGRLCVEITESVALHDLNNTRRFIDKVRSYGVKVALDDFGAGYTSFSYLKELPADVLKIDGSFVVNMNEHPTNVAIVEAIVNLAMNLGMKTIAEWAEDHATVQTLAEIGVDYVQGFAVARPQDPARLLEAESSASFIKDDRLANFVRTLGKGETIHGQTDLLELLHPKKLH
ncbi:EAL domain-containing protein [Janthinobacterium sp. 17J80-10]|uniref:putative bifunctional diguanylate cyclase/phosphodiesterase n=1 Tax=Janthinobacterium sp. 17J80-10 TaxID=2497863 RepID=UPI0010057BED|nr:EAL domain-containing protein [Janthinobacterium sp. 17J80-10]QAU33218.1 EAL domain-containing protein [Janthinobacterium sp. 17J80-10]